MKAHSESQASPAHRTKRLWGLAAKAILSLLLLFFVFRKFNIDAVLMQVRGARVSWLVGATVIFLLNTAFLALRWSTLSLGFLKFGKALEYTWIGLFFGAVIPGGISGDIGKGVSLALHDKSFRTRLLPASIFFDKLVGLAVLAVFFVLSVAITLATKHSLTTALNRALVLALIFVSVATAAAILIVLFLRTRAWASIVERLTNTRWARFVNAVSLLPQLYANRTWELGKATILSAAGHVNNMVAYWLILKAMGLEANFPFALILYSVLSVATMMPVSISGVGVRDVVSAGLFPVFGFSSEAGVAFSWVVLAINIPMVAIGGCVQGYELFSRKRRENASPCEEDSPPPPLIYLSSSLSGLYFMYWIT